jgi:hypothetical protein
MKIKEIIIDNDTFDLLDKVHQNTEDDLYKMISDCSIDPNELIDFINTNYQSDIDSEVESILLELENIKENKEEIHISSSELFEIQKYKNQIEVEVETINADAYSLLERESNRLVDRLRYFESEISVCKSNLYIIANNSETSSSLYELEEKIDNTKRQIEKLSQYFIYLRDYSKQEFFNFPFKFNQKNEFKRLYHFDTLNQNLPHSSSTEITKRGYFEPIRQFFLGFGNGYTFIGNEVKVFLKEEVVHIDLVFYNRILQNTVLFELKFGEISHQDINIMKICTAYFDKSQRMENENYTMGIIVGVDDGNTIVEFSLPKIRSKKLLHKYQSVLPKEEDLIKVIEKV